MYEVNHRYDGVTHVEVVPAVDIPLDLVAIPLWGKRIEAMAVGNLVAFLVGTLLMLLIVTMVWVDDIGKLADGRLHVMSLDFGIVDAGILELFCQT